MNKNSNSLNWRLVPAGGPEIDPPPAASQFILRFAGGDPAPKRTIRAGRRRQSATEGPVSGERPAAPRRRETGGGPSIPGGGGGGGLGSPGGGGGLSFPGGGLGPIPGGGAMPRLSCGALVLIAIVACVLIAVFGLGDTSGLLNPGLESSGPGFEPQSTLPGIALATEEPTHPPLNLATRTPRPSTPAAPAGGSPAAAGDSWLVMLYQDADDKVLEQDIFLDLNEAERVGSTDKVTIVAQMDRYRSGFSGDGDWTTAKRFLITRDDDLNRIRSQELADLGEVNMADGRTLVDFVTWAVDNYPADRYALILSDHGMGWPGGWSDPTAGRSGVPGVALAQAIGDQIFLNELDAALKTIRSRTGLKKLDLIGLDACLMSHAEVLSALAPHAQVAVLSQETEPALGWAYTGFLTTLTQNPGIDSHELGRRIVDTYITEDQRIVDDQARSEFLRQGSPFGSFGGVSANQLASQLERDITLTAVDLNAVPALTEALNRFAFALQNADQRVVAKARSYARSFTNIFGGGTQPSYIDLGNFAQLVARESGNRSVQEAAQALLTAVQQSLIAEKHGSNKRGATGISIYFPTSNLYRVPAAGPQSYTAIADRFSSETLWDDFLAYHYTGRSFEIGDQTIVVPQRPEQIRAPAAGGIRLSPIRLSSTVAAPGSPVLMSADVSGENIGYIKLFVGLLDPAANSIYVADLDYLESEDTREVDGVFYPDWGEGAFTLELDWEPTLFAIRDGQTRRLALFSPETYGATADEAIYTVEGSYLFADGETRSARMYFQDGVMRQVFTFQGQADTGAPREVKPQAGDRIVLLERWMDLDSTGKVIENAQQEGETILLGDRPLTWEEMYAPPGGYVIGFIVEDLDGNEYAAYAEVTVR